MEELKVLPREVQTITYDLGYPAEVSDFDTTDTLVASNTKLIAACGGLDVLHQRVMRGLNPEVRTWIIGTIYTERLNAVQRAAFDQVLREGAV